MIKQNSRKHYDKPRINKVKLEIEEAVLTNCKVSTSTGKSNRTCSASQCKTPGS